jgi:hypothetical protein
MSVLRTKNRHLQNWGQGSCLRNPCVSSSCLWIVSFMIVSDDVTLNDRWLISNELSSNLCGRKQLCTKLRFSPCLCYLQEARKVTKNVSQDIQSRGRVLISGPSENEKRNVIAPSREVSQVKNIHFPFYESSARNMPRCKVLQTYWVYKLAHRNFVFRAIFMTSVSSFLLQFL